MPFVNRWGPEDVTRVRIAHDPHIGRVGVFHDDDPDGAPDFTRQNPGRQRQCMAGGLCQVCAHPVPWSRRFLVASAETLEIVEVAGVPTAVTFEPWLCGRCADFALRYCPALIRRTRTDRLTLIPVTSRRQAVMVAAVASLDGPLREESLRVLPTLTVKVGLPGVFTVDRVTSAITVEAGD